jgi:hypothetical protein
MKLSKSRAGISRYAIAVFASFGITSRRHQFKSIVAQLEKSTDGTLSGLHPGRRDSIKINHKALMFKISIIK